MKLKSLSGSALLAVMTAVILLSVAAASVLELARSAYQLSVRNEARAQARSVAESELEAVYFQFITQVVTAMPPADVPAALGSICDVGATPSTTRDAFLKEHRDAGWKVKRSIEFETSFTGQLPDDPTKTGTVSYVSVRIEVVPGAGNFFSGTSFTMRVGRRFETRATSIFQYGIFFQGDLEMSPGGDVTINGDIAANGSIYMASTRKPDGTMGTLLIKKQVRYLTGGYFNETSAGATTLYKPNTPPGGAKQAPFFAATSADQVLAKANQLETLSEPENLLGGSDALELIGRRPDLFQSTKTGATDADSLNLVYRSLIVPPPSETTEYPNYDAAQGDDPSISVQRIYNRAGLIVTVNTDNTYSITKVDPVTHSTIDVKANYAGVVTGTTSMYDQREAKNVSVTSIDVGALATALGSQYTDFNGVLYVNVKGSTETTPRAVRLTNAATVPAGASSTVSNGKGFSVATNGGLYIKGDYNTTTPAMSDGSTNPALLMADAVTLLSTAWDDTNANQPIASRISASSTTLNAGILTGNTSATSSTASGGAQNLIRYLEDWTGKDVVINGSIGRLFDSQSFTSVYQQPGSVYLIPNSRNFVFDSALQNHPPAGSPTTTAFSRGTFFIW